MVDDARYLRHDVLVELTARDACRVAGEAPQRRAPVLVVDDTLGTRYGGATGSKVIPIG